MRWGILWAGVGMLGCHSQVAPPLSVGVTQLRVRSQGAAATLDWDPPPVAASYRVYAAPDPEVHPDLDGVRINIEGDEDTTFRDLSPYTEYWFVVIAHRGDGTPLPPSPLVSITPLAPGEFGVPIQLWETTAGATTVSFGNAVASAGDVDGDGQIDLLVGSDSRSEAWLFGGTPAGFGATAQLLADNGDFGDALVHADVNQDGFQDAIIGAPAHSNGGTSNSGRVSLFLGGSDGLNPSPAALAAGPGSSFRLGDSLAVGRFDDDTDVDVLDGAPGASGAARVFEVRGTPPELFETWESTQRPGMSSGDDVAVGDFNGDGLDDAAISQSGTPGAVEIYWGKGNGLADTPDATIDYPDLGPAVCLAVGDFDGDGRDDLVVGDRDGRGGGTADLYMGPSLNGVDWHFEGSAGSQFAEGLAAGDINGDAHPDLLVSAPGESGNGRLFVFSGGTDGLADTPAWSLAGNDFGATRFGDSIGLIHADGDGALELASGDPQWTDGNTFGRVQILAAEPTIGPGLRVRAVEHTSTAGGLDVTHYSPPTIGTHECIVDWGGIDLRFLPCDELPDYEKDTLPPGRYQVRVTAVASNGAVTRIVSQVRIGK